MPPMTQPGFRLAAPQVPQVDDASAASPITRLLQDWQLRRQATGKIWNVPICLKPLDGRIRAFIRSHAPTLVPRLSLLPPLAFCDLADDREMVLRSADCGAQELGVIAADGQLPAGQCKIDSIRALQLQLTSARGAA